VLISKKILQEQVKEPVVPQASLLEHRPHQESDLGGRDDLLATPGHARQAQDLAPDRPGVDRIADGQLRESVRQLLLRNVREGYSGLLGRHYSYIAPSPTTYPFQWFWDTCFHVLILARLGEYEVAKKNLRSLFAMQEENGFVGHMIFWNQLLPKRRSDVLQANPRWETLRPHMSALIQPTFVATSLLRLFEACGDRVYLGEMYASIKRYHDWLARNRDFDGDGLLTIISPFESGMDWKPSYDPVLGYAKRETSRALYSNALFWKGVAIDLANFFDRYDLSRIRRRGRFLVKDAGVNAIYAADLTAMETLAGLAGDDPLIYRQRRQRVEESMLALMYDEQHAAFYDVKEPGSQKIRINTATIFFPLAAVDISHWLAERVIARHFESRDGFNTPFPLPSVALRDSAFYPGETKFIWRGPTWAFNNWFLFHALKQRGNLEQAQYLRESLRHLIKKSGFREYYNPLTGEGYGAREFTWSGLILDMV
jgi:glycogen debranching enzyme